jgi:hypothetical protein
MPRDELANVYVFADRRPQGAAAGAETDGPTAATAGQDSAGADTADRVGEMKAVLSCLEYLYGEAVRVQARMSAHLIGAAAESMRREIAEAEGPQG